MARKIWPELCSGSGVIEGCTVMADEVTASQQGQPECRALVVVSPAQSCPARRPQAAFVMQLIACERRLGAYRTARRAQSNEAASLYASRVNAQRSFQRVV